MVESPVSAKEKLALPIGQAPAIEKFYQNGGESDLAVFRKVRNRVYWVNDDIYFPLKLVKGQSTPLGVFADEMKENFDLNGWKPLTMELVGGHGRSAILGRFLFADRQGRVWRDIDLKGIGWVEGCSIRSPKRQRGMLTFCEAMADASISEQLLALGVRTYRTIGVVRIYQYNCTGFSSLRPTSELIDDAVVQIRAFRTRSRLSDLEYMSSNLPKLILEDAVSMVSVEMGEKLGYESYLQWFSKTYGESVGRMHRAGWHNPNLSDHNLTLDCTQVDWDMLQELVRNGDRKDDVQHALSNLYVLSIRFKQLGLAKLGQVAYARLFMEGYDSVFPVEARRAFFRDPDSIRIGL